MLFEGEEESVEFAAWRTGKDDVAEKASVSDRDEQYVRLRS